MGVIQGIEKTCSCCWQLRDLSSKVKKTIQPVFTSRKLKQDLSRREPKPNIVTHNAFFLKIFLSVTIAMQVMSGTQRATFTRELRDTIKRRHPFKSIIP